MTPFPFDLLAGAFHQSGIGKVCGGGVGGDDGRYIKGAYLGLGTALYVKMYAAG
jgi:hypothetical protein